MKRNETEDDGTQPFGRGYIVFLLVMGALLVGTIYLELWVESTGDRHSKTWVFGDARVGACPHMKGHNVRRSC